MTYTLDLRTGGNALVLAEREPGQSVLQNIMVILSTPKGSVPQYREFGLDMRFVDKPEQVARTMLIAAVMDAVSRFEQRAEVKNITLESNGFGKLTPILEVEINEQ